MVSSQKSSDSCSSRPPGKQAVSPEKLGKEIANEARIPDPYVDLNEIDIQWIGEKSWTYRVELPSLEYRDGFKTEIVFNGLDTFAIVKLNGTIILQSDNMFIPLRADVTNLLKGTNQLEIEFESSLLRARELQRLHPNHKYLCWNGEPARLTTRKAQYHWGWDWGPILMTAGPWRAVRVESFSSRIADLWVEYEVDIVSKIVKGTIFARIDGQSEGEVEFLIQQAGRHVFGGKSSPGHGGVAYQDFELQEVNLWWPHGYGSQHLYDFAVLLRVNNHQIDDKRKKIGLRQAELVQQVDKIGRSFFFRINGVDIFCGGSNWIPADNFTPRISKERYRRWIQMMVDGNQHMIR